MKSFGINIIGWVPEWSKGADCKSAGDAYGGSNPPPSTTLIINQDDICICIMVPHMKIL